MITVNAEKCPQNHKCPSMAVCPQGAISQKDIYALPQVDQEKCVSCGKCIRYCPKGAFEKVVLLQGRRHPGETARILSVDDVLRWKDSDSVSDGGLGRRFSVPAGWGNRP